MRRLVPVLLAGLLALAGCGTSGDESAKHAAPRASASAPRPPKPLPSPSKYVDDDKDGSLVPDNLDISAVPDPTGAPVGPDRRVFGADVSWPQCPRGMGIPQKPGHGAPMPTEAAEFVVIGLTNGPSFVRNPCLKEQLAWVRQRGLLAAPYAVVSYPDQRTLDKLGGSGPFAARSTTGRLSNVGYQAALYNLASARAVGLRTPFVWIDVESVPHFDWSSDAAANAAVVRGSARGYRDAGVAYGIYSTPHIWNSIVGDLRLGVPEWRPAGSSGMGEALRRCAEDWSIQGGPAYLGQWVEDGRDRNVTCPGQGGRIGQLFHRY